MVKRGDLVDANEFVVKVEIRLKLKREELADSNYFGVRRQVCGFQFAITLFTPGRESFKFDIFKCLYLVDLNNPRILMTHDKMAVAANTGA